MFIDLHVIQIFEDTHSKKYFYDRCLASIKIVKIFVPKLDSNCLTQFVYLPFSWCMMPSFKSAVQQPPWVYWCNYLHGSAAHGLLMIFGAGAGSRTWKLLLLSLLKVLELKPFAGLQPDKLQGCLGAALWCPILLNAHSKCRRPNALLYFHLQSNKTSRWNSCVCFSLLIFFFFFRRTQRFLWIKKQQSGESK